MGLKDLPKPLEGLKVVGRVAVERAAVVARNSYILQEEGKGSFQWDPYEPEVRRLSWKDERERVIENTCD